MATDVRVPTTGNAGEDAVLVEWNVGVGSTVAQGEVLAVLETAKAAMEVEAPVAGQVLQLLYAAGDEVPEHAVLVVIGEPGENPTAEPVPQEEAGENAARPEVAEPVQDASTPAESGRSTDRVSISPRARALAQQRSVDVTTLVGSGPLGRIVIRDIPAAAPAMAPPDHRAVAQEPNQRGPFPDADAAAVSEGPGVRAGSQSQASSAGLSPSMVVPVRGARKATAQRMQSSLTETAQLTLTRYADATALLAYAPRLRSYCEARSLPKIGLNDILMFAVARAVARHPAINAWFGWDGIAQYDQVNLGFAVDTERALLVPVIPDAARLTMAELAAAARNLIARARGGSLTAQEMDQGTFTVSNLGGLGVHWFTPVLNPPQVGILGIGAAHRAHPDAPAWIPLSLTFDHRALDGAAAASALADIAATIESIDLLSAF
jgi:pyruvate dehydrogenase E2 component (dihydrolipoamide acetyltransferase)